MRIHAMLLTVALAATATLARAEDAAADPVANGKAVTEKLKCSICHVVDGKGGKMGKPMAELAAGKTDEFLKGSLLTPKETIDPKTKMPSYKGKMTDAEVADVIAYMKSLVKK